MKRKSRAMARATALAAVLATVVSFGVQPATAAPNPKHDVVVHYYRPDGNYQDKIRVLDSTGKSTGTLVNASNDSFGRVLTFAMPSLSKNAHAGVAIDEDSTFPGDERFLQAYGADQEIWAVDSDARLYGKPTPVANGDVIEKGNTGYISVNTLAPILGLTTKTAKNTYVFDGAPVGTVPILTIYRGRDYYEINTDSNRIGSNVTSNMTSNYTNLVFNDVDGFSQNGQYYLSFGQIERTFQVKVLATDNGVNVLIPVPISYNKVTKASPESVGFDESSLQGVDQYIQSQEDQGAASVNLSVVKDGKLVKQSAYGYSKKYSTTENADGTIEKAQLLPQDQWQKATTDTLYDLASNTKMYATNYAIQQLVSEGKIDLDKPLSQYPGWENYKDSSTIYTGDWTVGGAGGITQKYTGKDTVTIRDILHHEGGLIPDPQYQNKKVAGDLFYQDMTNLDRTGIIQKICETPLMYAPRTTFAYSDVDYMILGILIEQITGMTEDQYVQKYIYKPMGLKDTTYLPLENGFDPDQIAATELNGNTRDGTVDFGTYADGTPVYIRKYTLQGEVHDEKAYYSMGGVSGHAGLFSTSGDMAQLTQVMLNGGYYNGVQLFTPEVAKEFTTPYADPGHDVDKSSIGMGWRLNSKTGSDYYYFNWGPSRSSYGHTGWTGTLTVIDPLQDMTITILSNYRHSPVVDPPNGFQASEMEIADHVPVTGRIYDSLSNDTEHLATAGTIAPVGAVSVAAGASAADVLAALPSTGTVVDTAGNSHAATLAWHINGVDTNKPGSYQVSADVTLPISVVAGSVPMTTTTTVTVASGSTPTPTPTPSDGGSGGGSSSGGSAAGGGQMPATGTNALTYGALAVLVIGIGIGAITVRRRRAHQSR